MLLCLLLVTYPSLPLLTGPIVGYPGYSPEALVDWMYFTLEGIFGVSLGVSTTTIFPFILMGSFLEKVGITDFFTDFAKTLVGFMRGGPAKVSVVSSAFFGTVSGSAVANVMVDGQFTIPTMVKAGYTPYTAAAVEAVASTGGYITPPVMGAVAFLMAEIIGVSYWTIALCAVLPAALYYIALFVQVHLRACSLGLHGIPRRDLPSKLLLLKRIYYLFPLGLLVAMLSSDYSPYTSCIAALVSTLPIGFFLKTERIGVRDIVSALEDGAKSALLIIVTCAGAGFILGCLSMTGLGILLCGAIVKLSAGNLILTLLLAMLVNILIGMGVGSPIAAYLALVGTTIPVMIQLGVHKIAAHMYTLYFANISYITPPVAMAVFAAAAIAKTSIWKTGWAAVRLGIGGFIVPFMFVYDPSLLLLGSAPEVIVSFATAVAGVVALCVVVEGWFYTRTTHFQRLLFLIGGVLLIAPGVFKDLLGVSLIAAGALLNRHSARRVPFVNSLHRN
jgi:TRAP transporter 4TM/12TM fusion protein